MYHYNHEQPYFNKGLFFQKTIVSSLGLIVPKPANNADLKSVSELLQRKFISKNSGM